METFLLRIADIGLLTFHGGLTLFNLFGWIWRKSRPANLITLLLTGGSWFILGLWYGLGYCPLTDWHWDVLRRLGEPTPPRSYITYVLQRLLGFSVAGPAVERWTGILFFLALALSLGLTIRDRLRKRRRSPC
ncbi:MAG: DUF2784 family protein [Alkalispirochaetaceae bacterium]